MVTFRAFGLALLASLSLAAPLQPDSSSPELVARQSTRWNDPYIKKPYGEAAQNLGGCDYQVTFRRDWVDSRSTIRFYATYPGSLMRRQLMPISSTSYAFSGTKNADYGRYTIENIGYVISVHQFRGVCASGTGGNTPSAFYVRSTLGSGYTYTNDWISPAFAPTNTALPSPPTSVQIAKVAGTTGNYTVSWTPSASATGGYYVLARIDVYASELGTRIPSTRTLRAVAAQHSVGFRVGSRDALASVGVSSILVGTDVVSDASRVQIVPAPSA